jgi:hypothetical protein
MIPVRVALAFARFVIPAKAGIQSPLGISKGR